MAINLHCYICKSSSSIRSRLCKTCGFDFSKGKKYRVVVKGPNGKRISKIVDSILVAKKLEGKIKTQTMEKNLLGINQVPMLEQAWDKYLAWARENKKSWRDDLMRWECHIKAKIAAKKMDSILPLDIHGVIEEMKSKREYAPATIKQVIVLIKRVYNWSIQMEIYVGDNPATKVKVPRVNNERTECLNREEISRLLSALDRWANQRVSLLVRFALLTGLRRGEIFALEWKNVDKEKGIILLEDTKGGKDIYLPISQEALDTIKKAEKLLPSSQCRYVFPSREGKKRTTLGNTWMRIRRIADIPPKFRFHGLRHTFASHLASSGRVSQYTLQKLLTHKSPQMTQRYAHLFDETLREGVNLMSVLIN